MDSEASPSIDAAEVVLSEDERVALQQLAKDAGVTVEQLPITGTFSKTVHPLLYVRCQENETDVFIVLGMMLDTPYSVDRPDHAAITIRYDDSPAKEQWFPVSTDREAIFLVRQ